MAKVYGHVLGGEPKCIEAGNVRDVKRMLNVPNHAASVNGDTVTDDYNLEENEVVHLAPAVKGGC